MLYASKVINQKLRNDRAVQELLAERIRDIYIKREEETQDILKNIMEMWTWIPQLKVVITAIGLIGDQDELLDLVLLNYGEDENLKDRAFYAFMQNKTLNNLERALKIITNLENTEEDHILGRRFVKEFDGFGYEGYNMIKKYHEHPAVTRTGRKYIRTLIIRIGDTDPGTDSGGDGGIYRDSLAKKSVSDDMAFKDFLEDCREHRDRKAAFLCRFSRAEIGQFLKEMLEEPERLDSGIRNDAIISLAMAGRKGYHPAAAIIKDCYLENEENYAPIVGETILGEPAAIRRLIQFFCEARDYELYGLFRILSTANLRYYTDSLNMIQSLIYESFTEFAAQKDYESLGILTGNLNVLWEKRLYFLLSAEMLKYIQKLLLDYAEGREEGLTEEIVIAMIGVIVHSWGNSVEDVIFCLLHHAESKKVQQMSYKILQGKDVQAPK